MPLRHPDGRTVPRKASLDVLGDGWRQVTATLTPPWGRFRKGRPFSLGLHLASRTFVASSLASDTRIAISVFSNTIEAKKSILEASRNIFSCGCFVCRMFLETEVYLESSMGNYRLKPESIKFESDSNKGEGYGPIRKLC